MRKRNARFFFVAALFSMNCAHHVEAQEGKKPSSGDAFSHVYMGADVGFSAGRCQVDYIMDEPFITGSDPETGVSPTYYEYQTGEVITSPVALPGEVINYQTEYALSVGDLVRARGNQLRLDVIAGGNVHVGHDILLGADAVLRYTPGVIEGFGYVSADIATDVIGDPVSCPSYYLSNLCNNMYRYPNSDSEPASFVYETQGFTEINIHNSWTVDFLLNMGYAVSPAVSLLLKAGVSLGFWDVDGAVNFQSTENLEWCNFAFMVFGGSQDPVFFHANHVFKYNPDPEEMNEDFSENSTFVGLVLAPTVQMKISQDVVAFLKIEFSLYENQDISFETENIGVVDLGMENVSTVSGLLGIVYTFGGK